MKPPTPIQFATRELMGRMLVFCRQYPRLNFAQWPPESMAGYLNWLASQDALRFTWGAGPSGAEITGLLLGWRTTTAALAQPEFATASYKYARPILDGDAFFVEVLAGYPGTVAMLAADHQWHFPDWRKMQYYGVRRGRMVKYGDAERLFARLEKL